MAQKRLTYDAAPGAANPVLLFYKEHENDSLFPGDRYLKRIIRPIWRMLHRNQKVSGFGMSFQAMCHGLSEAGHDVIVNDYALARANPDYPVGVIGNLSLLDNWTLPNPALLGPSLYDQPGQAPDLFEDKRFRAYVCLADWMYDLFETQYAGKCVKWFAGIDTEAWPDRSNGPKTLDFIIYDKIHWDYEAYAENLIEPIRRELDARGLSHRTIRYRYYDHPLYHELLTAARGMIFLSENETQGLAYQEAMSCNVPILAWDRGYWADPQAAEHFGSPPKASCVPFFSEACGGKFTGIEDFSASLDSFMKHRDGYEPREFVKARLSPKQSAQTYAAAYFAIAKA